MSVYNLMRTGVSGMGAQSNRLGTVADNIANARTTGYKRASTEFASLVLDNHGTSYASGGVESKTRYAISQKGTLEYSSSGSDLAVNGQGFFLVGDPDGKISLTRAGAFVPMSDGTLMNTAGYRLMGYPITNGNTNAVVNGTAGLEAVNIRSTTLVSEPTTSGLFNVNLDADEAVVAGDLPSDNLGTSTFTHTSSLTAYDNLGREVTLDVYYTKTGTAPDTWEVAIFDRAEADPTTGNFPYGAGPLSTATLTFDGSGALDTALPSDTSITLNVPGGASLTIDMSQTTQKGADYTVIDAELDGSEPAAIEGVEFSDDGIIYAVYENGARAAIYRVPLANVASPDNLKPEAGTVFSITADSGDLQIGFPGEGALGGIVSGALESSNVDLASELTTMIESQRNYTANSKVFQTGSEILEVLVNLKR